MTGSSTRSRAARKLAGVMTVLVLVTGAVGVGIGVLASQVVPAAADEPAIVVTATGQATFTGAQDQPVYLLMIGNDERPGVEGQRADALHLVGINPANHSLTILNFPRDTYIEYPGGGSHRINEGNPRGGPELQAQLVSDLVGVPIAFTVEVNFAAFTGLIDELGGVDVNVPFDMEDRNSGAHFDAGPHHFTGDEALAFSRDRHLTGGDFTRTRNQASVIIAALAAAQAHALTPASSLGALSTFLQYGQFHGGDLADLYRLGRLALTIDPATIRSQLVPGQSGNAGGASVVFLTDDAPALFADFADDAVLQVYPPDPPL